jgi:hypothetical protein
MKNDVTFVTAVYDSLSTTEFAGRHNRGTQYAFSLAQMHNMGAPIYCYTDKVNMQRYFPALYAHGMENFNFINFNLDEHPLHTEIQKVKDGNKKLYRESSAWSSRCVEIMWGKFDWILHTIEQIGESEDKYLYWVDAGLAHGGILPVKYNSIYKPDDPTTNASKKYNDSFMYDQIFNSGFPDYLAEYTGKNKLLHMVCRNPQHDDPSHLPPNKDVKGTAVGGLFGGNTKMLKVWAEEAIEVCKDLLEHGYVIKEEDINSYLINKHYSEDIVTYYMFDTWYHEDWLKDISRGVAFHPETQQPFCNFFEDYVKSQSL